MRGANEMDGAVGFTQCPIPVGGNFTYEFQIDEDQHGTFWYHAHSQLLRGDGLYGGLVVHRPVVSSFTSEADDYGYAKDILLMVGDWYHATAEEVLGWHLSPDAFGNNVSGTKT
jgi:FtsP/CotA-like multicopper oxidase with cupredoxin domain